MAFFFYYATQPLGLSGTAYDRPDILSVAHYQQCRSTDKGNSKPDHKDGNSWPHPFFIQHQSPEGKGITSFMS